MEYNYEELFLGMGISTILSIGLFITIIFIVAMWRIFEKAGKPGWLAIIPIVNTYTIIKIVGKPGWWLILLIFVPFVNIILAIWITNLLAKSFGKDELFTIGLLFFSIIFYPILGFGNARYIGPAGR